MLGNQININIIQTTSSNFVAVELEPSASSIACNITLANAVNIELSQLPPAQWLAQLVKQVVAKQL